jgi:hypothetical protein
MNPLLAIACLIPLHELETKWVSGVSFPIHVPQLLRFAFFLLLALQILVISNLD